jgi:hypothetical protein
MPEKEGKSISDGTVAISKEANNGEIIWKYGNVEM